MSVTAISDIWNKSDATIKAERVDLAVRRLKSSADLFIVEAEGQVLDARASLSKAEQDAVKNPDFGALVQARLAVKTAELTLREGRAAVAEYFPSEG